MRLTDLDPMWVADYEPAQRSHRRGDDLTLATAQGIVFDCPVCSFRNADGRGSHSILAWFRGRGVPDDAVPGPGRWTPSGTGFEDLSLTPSINCNTASRTDCWHGFITNGEVR